VDKPFALMMPDIETIEQHCFVDEAERELLESTARPIVLLKRKPDSPISRECAPGQDTLGVMLPYTPLHYLLFDDPIHPFDFAHRSCRKQRRHAGARRQGKPSSFIL